MYLFLGGSICPAFPRPLLPRATRAAERWRNLAEEPESNTVLGSFATGALLARQLHTVGPSTCQFFFGGLAAYSRLPATKPYQ